MVLKMHLVSNLSTLSEIVSKICDAYKGHVFAFSGPLGAGKTTLIKAMLVNKGVLEYGISSPTFTYYNIYTNDKGDKFYHFDLYRLCSSETFINMGFHELLEERNVFIYIEWPEIIRSLLPTETCYIRLDYGNDLQERTVAFACSQ